MKKRIGICVIAAALLCALGGCGESSQPAQTSSIPVAEETNSAATTTTAESTTTVAEATTTTLSPDESSAPDETGSSAADHGQENEAFKESNFAKLTERMSGWDKGVKVVFGGEQSGVSFSVEVLSYNKKAYTAMNMLGMNTITLTDGDTVYQLDKNSKSYCKTDVKSSQESSGTSNMLDEVNPDFYVGKGEETVNGIHAKYDEFNLKDASEKLDQTVKFYFDDEDNLFGCKVINNQATDPSLKEVFMKYEVTLLETVDESLFTLPSDYKEVTQQEMATLMMQGMFGSIGEMIQDTDNDNNG